MYCTVEYIIIIISAVPLNHGSGRCTSAYSVNDFRERRLLQSDANAHVFVAFVDLLARMYEGKRSEVEVRTALLQPTY